MITERTLPQDASEAQNQLFYQLRIERLQTLIALTPDGPERKLLQRSLWSLTLGIQDIQQQR